MVQIAGKYEIVESHNFKELLTRRGIPEDKALIANDVKTVLEVTVDGKKVTLKADVKLGNHVTELLLDGESEEKVPNATIKSISKLEGNIIKVESKGADGTHIGNRTYTFTDYGLEIVYSEDSFTARRVYKRL